MEDVELESENEKFSVREIKLMCMSDIKNKYSTPIFEIKLPE